MVDTRSWRVGGAAIALTPPDLIDIWAELLPCTNAGLQTRGGAAVCRGAFNIHEGAFRSVLQRRASPSNTSSVARTQSHSRRATCCFLQTNPDESRHAALNLPWHFLIDFL